MNKSEKIELLYSLIKTDPTNYVTDDDVKSILDTDEIELFYKYMNGQGCPLIGSEPCYFPWDVSRFIRNEVK